MRRNILEAKGLELLDRVKASQPVEDAYVELKREWIEPRSAARRLAGLANAARGEPILWMVGVDEDSQSIPGAPPEELANWFPQVQSCFDEVAPEILTDVVVPYDGAPVTVLHFATDRAPYLIKNPSGYFIGKRWPGG